MASRTTHQVRITHPDDKTLWIDVEVLDAITVLGSKGQEITYEFGPINPSIEDLTGDFGGGGGGSGSNRTSYIERISGNDSAQFFDAEVLTGYVCLGSNGQEFSQALNAQDYGIVSDDGGVGFDPGNSAASTGRATHTVKISETTDKVTDSDGVPSFSMNSDDPSGGQETTPPKFLAIVKVDGLVHLTSGKPDPGQEFAMSFDSRSTDNKIDTTEWTTDSDTGDKRPPDNMDPNPYIVWPRNPKPDGPWVGATPTHGSGSDSGPVNQGPLWWIKRTGKQGTPWYWYLKTIQELEFSQLGGFPMLLPNYAEVKILAIDKREFPAEPIPTQGFSSLEDAANHFVALGNVDNAKNQVQPNSLVNSFVQNQLSNYDPSQHTGGETLSSSNPVFNAYADIQDWMDLDVPGHAGGLIGIDFWGWWGILGGSGNNTFFGTPMLSPPKPGLRFPPGTIINGIYPDIWQLTKLKHPDLTNPNKPWEQIDNPYLPPSVDLAEKCAKTFEKMWNDASMAMEESILAAAAVVVPVSSAPFAPPRWDFGMPFIDTYVGLNQAWSFNAGINAALAHFPEVTVTWPMPCYIGVGQLDPKEWDTTNFPPAPRSGGSVPTDPNAQFDAGRATGGFIPGPGPAP